MGTQIRYYGWSALSIETAHGPLYFDPFYRHYCGAQWFELDAFKRAKVVCVTHGHEEHFLDTPAVVKASGATVVAHKAVTDYLRWRYRVPAAQLRPVPSGGTVEVPGFKVSTFTWKHRDINLYKALTKAVFHGNATQLSWAWSSATNAPFYSPYTGFHVELPDGTTVLNYNEGFNSKMTDAEITDLGRRFRTDVLLAGMQLNFMADIERGVRALAPKLIVLYPPHDKFHTMMGVTSEPWSRFIDAAQRGAPNAAVIEAVPGSVIDIAAGKVTETLPVLPERAAA
jgi:L-ascorbate metabolism protein UlaG (beta-lactamase superfamily)